MPRAFRDFSPIYPTEQVTLSFDFSPALAVGETIGSPSLSIAVVSGIDATPSARLIGAASISGSFVLQAVGTMQVGVIYDIIATVTTSSGQILTTNAHLAVPSNVA
jgi:hypothetical protein